MSSILSGLPGFFVRELSANKQSFRIDGAFEPWVKKLIESLVRIFPLLPGTSTTPEDALPPPRVSVSEADPSEIEPPDQILLGDETYASATVSCNRRITADDWYQDVRHFEFDFDIGIQWVCS